MMSSEKYQNYLNAFSDKPVNENRSAVFVNFYFDKNFHLHEIADFYRKYFNASRQANIICMANILNFTPDVLKIFKSQNKEAYKMNNKKLMKEMTKFAPMLFRRNTEKLQTNFQHYFLSTISGLNNADFINGVRMITVAIFSIFIKLSKPKNKNHFEVLILLSKLICLNLKLTRDEFPIVYGLYESNYFWLGCLDTLSLIENSQTHLETSKTCTFFFRRKTDVCKKIFGLLGESLTKINKDLTLIIKNCHWKVLEKMEKEVTSNVINP